MTSEWWKKRRKRRKSKKKRLFCFSDAANTQADRTNERMIE